MFVQLILSLVLVFMPIIICENIELLECEPPDYPLWGGYGPRQDYYQTGDVIHYYCDTDTFIGGNFYRRCEDNGDWSGDTPVCDAAASFSTLRQSSTAEPMEENDEEKANDGDRTTCSSTSQGEDSWWSGKLEKIGQVLRVMLFLPKGNVAYEVISIREDGVEFSCGQKQDRITRYEWHFHNCREPNNVNIVEIKIKSLSPDIPLRLCEVVVHTLTEPTCVDPHYVVENGRFQLSRKVATLACNPGYTRSNNAKLDCIRTGVWSKKTIYCAEKNWEVERPGPVEQP